MDINSFPSFQPRAPMVPPPGAAAQFSQSSSSPAVSARAWAARGQRPPVPRQPVVSHSGPVRGQQLSAWQPPSGHRPSPTGKAVDVGSTPDLLWGGRRPQSTGAEATFPELPMWQESPLPPPTSRKPLSRGVASVPPYTTSHPQAQPGYGGAVLPGRAGMGAPSAIPPNSRRGGRRRGSLTQGGGGVMRRQTRGALTQNKSRGSRGTGRVEGSVWSGDLLHGAGTGPVTWADSSYHHSEDATNAYTYHSGSSEMGRGGMSSTNPYTAVAGLGSSVINTVNSTNPYTSVDGLQSGVGNTANSTNPYISVDGLQSGVGNTVNSTNPYISVDGLGSSVINTANSTNPYISVDGLGSSVINTANSTNPYISVDGLGSSVINTANSTNPYTVAGVGRLGSSGEDRMRRKGNSTAGFGAAWDGAAWDGAAWDGAGPSGGDLHFTGSGGHEARTGHVVNYPTGDDLSQWKSGFWARDSTGARK